MSKTWLVLVVALVGWSSISQAALPWPAAAVSNLKKRLNTGACVDANADKLSRDICALYEVKPSKRKSSKVKLTQPQPSLLIIEKGSTLLKIERGDTESDFVINSVRIDFREVKTQAELKTKIENALNKKYGRALWWLPFAHAEPWMMDFTPALQQLVTETHQLGNCEFYLKFGKKCADTMKEIRAEINRRTRNGEGRFHKGDSNVLGKMLIELKPLYDRLEKDVFPSMEGYDTVRMCAVRKNSGNVNQATASAEAELKDCRERVTALAKDYGDEFIVPRETESMVSILYNRFFGQPRTVYSSVPASAPSASGDGRD